MDWAFALGEATANSPKVITNPSNNLNLLENFMAIPPNKRQSTG